MIEQQYRYAEPWLAPMVQQDGGPEEWERGDWMYRGFGPNWERPLPQRAATPEQSERIERAVRQRITRVRNEVRDSNRCKGLPTSAAWRVLMIHSDAKRLPDADYDLAMLEADEVIRLERTAAAFEVDGDILAAIQEVTRKHNDDCNKERAGTDYAGAGR